MNEKSEALRLADLLQDEWGVDGYVCDEAAAELRRLAAVEAQRDALLEVVDKLEYSFDGCIKRYPDEAEVNAAIKAVEEAK